MRKYLYIYGGFSFDCQTACLDLWRFELPYGPQVMYPKKIGEWHNTGNHWTLIMENANYSPGPRWRHSLTSIQHFPDANTNRDEHYIYIFGGIKILDEADVDAKRDLDQNYKSSYEFMGDLWRFDLESNQWEDLEVYGISSIRRQIFLWNGTEIYTDVPSDQKLKKDLNNIFIAKERDVEESNGTLTLELPPARGAHSAALVGNPADYLMIFGGASEEVLPGNFQVYKIKKTINDLWVYHTGRRLWSRLYVNSESPP